MFGRRNPGEPKVLRHQIVETFEAFHAMVAVRAAAWRRFFASCELEAALNTLLEQASFELCEPKPIRSVSRIPL